MPSSQSRKLVQKLVCYLYPIAAQAASYRLLAVIAMQPARVRSVMQFAMRCKHMSFIQSPFC